MWLAHVIWHGGRCHSLLMWMCVVTCCDYVWHKEWPMSIFWVWQYYCHRHCCVCGRRYSHYSWWYYHQLEWCDWHMLFDGVAHGIAYPYGCVLWDVVTMCGTGNGQRVHFFMLVFIMDCCTQPHPICEADCTCLCFCFGIDYLPLSGGLFFWL